MHKSIIEILKHFQISFNRKETYLWFILIVVGIITRDNFRGITSIIGGLNLNPKCYESIIHFYYSKAYSLEKLKNSWLNILFKYTEPIEIADRVLVLGDHIKITKEAKHMPGVKKHHQDSDNSGKAEYIYGHMFGMIGIVTKSIINYCIPVDIEIQDGIDEIRKLEKEEAKILLKSKDNCIAKMILMVYKMVLKTNKNVLFVLDAYFSKNTTFNIIEELNEKSGQKSISIITRARKNSVAYEKLEKPDNPKRGRPRKYGDRVKLDDLFKSRIKDFITETIFMYGKKEVVKYLQVKLMWKPTGTVMNFVLVKTGDRKMILMSENLNLNPVEMIVAYSYRFKIEVTFKMLKHSLGGFFYHFWTKAMPKISKYKTNTDYSLVKDDKSCKKLLETIRAIEIYVFVHSIVLGILMIISLAHPKRIWNKYNGWIRTRSSVIPSPETVKYVLSNEFIWNFSKISNNAIFEKIKSNQKSYNYKNLKDSA